jgi:hypothetical protein
LVRVQIGALEKLRPIKVVDALGELFGEHLSQLFQFAA